MLQILILEMQHMTLKSRSPTVFFLRTSLQDEDDEDDDVDSLFSPNASNIASPCPSAHNSSVTSLHTEGGPGTRAEGGFGLLKDSACGQDGQIPSSFCNGSEEDENKDAPAKRTRQNFSLKDKPLEVRDKGGGSYLK